MQDSSPLGHGDQLPQKDAEVQDKRAPDQEREMTYNYKQTGSPMRRIQAILKHRVELGESYKELAEKCSTTPATVSKWVKHGPELKWYSLFDICLGLELDLREIIKGSIWEDLVPSVDVLSELEMATRIGITLLDNTLDSKLAYHEEGESRDRLEALRKKYNLKDPHNDKPVEES